MQSLLALFVARLLDPMVIVAALMFGIHNRRTPAPYNILVVSVVGAALAIISYIILLKVDPTFRGSWRALPPYALLNGLAYIAALAVEVWLFRLLLRKRERAT